MVALLALLGCTYITAAEKEARRDRDGDGYTSTQWGGTDCDDEDPSVHPDQVELCNLVDDDCDGTTDVLSSGGVLLFEDADGDGYGGRELRVCEGTPGYVERGGDCADQDAAIHPDAQETCGPADEDCDGLVNDDDPSLDALGANQGYPDADGDGYGDSGALRESCEPNPELLSQGGDCDDGDPSINPAALESCASAADDDCDGSSDCTLGREQASWVVESPSNVTDLGKVLDGADLDRDGQEDLILGMPGSDSVGALSGLSGTAPAALDAQYLGQSALGQALATAVDVGRDELYVLVGGEESALLFQSDLASPLQGVYSETPGEGFGASVQLLHGDTWLSVVGAPQATTGRDAVYLFGLPQPFELVASDAVGTLRLEADYEDGAEVLLSLDHQGTGTQDLAVTLTTDSKSKPEAVALLAPWTGVLGPDDADLSLSPKRDPVQAMGSGDWNGDGRLDLAMGVPDASGGAGQVEVFWGPVTQDSADVSIQGGVGEGLGTRIISLDRGYSASAMVVGGGDGEIWVFEIPSAGGTLKSSSATLLFDGRQGDIAGSDLDGDGLDELIIGDPSAQGGAGELWVFTGAAMPL